MILSKTKSLIAMAFAGLFGCNSVSADYAKEYCDDFESRAESGDPSAQVELANCYIIGNGREIDYRVAEDWLKQAASLGNRKAAVSLAALILFKLDNRSRYEEAIDLLQDTTPETSHQSTFLLAVAYRNGMGVEKDNLESYRLFVVAAENGHAFSKFVVFGLQALNKHPKIHDRDIDSWRKDFENALPRLGVSSVDDFFAKIKDDKLILDYIFTLDEIQRISEFLL